MVETSENIRHFWFGTQIDDKAVADAQASLWWSKNLQIDQTIRQRFEPFIAKAASHELDDWATTPAGRLALILLTDQFPRNMYRDTPQAFAFDPLALAWCKDGIRQGMDQQLRPIERVFFYLPLQHVESRDDQQHSVALYEALLSEAVADHRATFENFLDFARKHRDIVMRFGRFPHRNRILGRESSAEERAFLEEKGSSF
jgi:uncharacterized protein (DUF924 family)